MITHETINVPENKAKYKNNAIDFNFNIYLSLFRNPNGVDFFINLSYNYYNILRILDYVSELTYTCKCDSAHRRRANLTISEIKVSETCLIRLAQSFEFKERDFEFKTGIKGYSFK